METPTSRGSVFRYHLCPPGNILDPQAPKERPSGPVAWKSPLANTWRTRGLPHGRSARRSSFRDGSREIIPLGDGNRVDDQWHTACLGNAPRWLPDPRRAAISRVRRVFAIGSPVRSRRAASDHRLRSEPCRDRRNQPAQPMAQGWPGWGAPRLEQIQRPGLVGSLFPNRVVLIYFVHRRFSPV